MRNPRCRTTIQTRNVENWETRRQFCCTYQAVVQSFYTCEPFVQDKAFFFLPTVLCFPGIGFFLFLDPDPVSDFLSALTVFFRNLRWEKFWICIRIRESYKCGSDFACVHRRKALVYLVPPADNSRPCLVPSQKQKLSKTKKPREISYAETGWETTLYLYIFPI